MSVLQTARLELRKFSLADAAFILELLNEPGFLRYIGDKGVRTLTDAGNYLQQGPIDSYARNGFGLYGVRLRADAASVPLGMCGLVRREGLPDPDLGFAFLQQHWGRGYAVESAAAVLDYGTQVLKLPRILAITAPDNWSSISVLEKSGMEFEALMQWSAAGEQVKLFKLAAGAGSA